MGLSIIVLYLLIWHLCQVLKLKNWISHRFASPTNKCHIKKVKLWQIVRRKNFCIQGISRSFLRWMFLYPIKLKQYNLYKSQKKWCFSLQLLYTIADYVIHNTSILTTLYLYDREYMLPQIMFFSGKIIFV